MIRLPPRSTLPAPFFPYPTLFRSLDLPAAKAVNNQLGCTVNDIVLALCGGALRRYLEACGEEVDSSLVAMVPMSVRTTDDAGGVGNNVTMIERTSTRLNSSH